MTMTKAELNKFKKEWLKRANTVPFFESKDDVRRLEGFKGLKKVDNQRLKPDHILGNRKKLQGLLLFPVEIQAQYLQLLQI